MSQPEIRLFRKLGDRSGPKKFGRAAFGSRFLRDRFDSILTVFVERSVFIRIRPRATRAVDSVKLIEVRKGCYPADQAGFSDGKLDRLENGFQSGRDLRWLGNTNRVRLNRRLGTWSFARGTMIRPIPIRRDAAVALDSCHEVPLPLVYDSGPRTGIVAIN